MDKGCYLGRACIVVIVVGLSGYRVVRLSGFSDYHCCRIIEIIWYPRTNPFRDYLSVGKGRDKYPSIPSGLPIDGMELNILDVYVVQFFPISEIRFYYLRASLQDSG